MPTPNVKPISDLPLGYHAERLWQDGKVLLHIHHHNRLLRREIFDPDTWLDDLTDDPAATPAIAEHMAVMYARAFVTLHTSLRQQLGENGLHDDASGISLRYCLGKCKGDPCCDNLDVGFYRHGQLLRSDSYRLYMPYFDPCTNFREIPDLLEPVLEDFWQLIAEHRQS